jgi:hypothetical protein
MLAAVNDNAALGDGVQIFAAGPTCCTACAPTSVRKSDVELEVSRGEPRGSIPFLSSYSSSRKAPAQNLKSFKSQGAGSPSRTAYEQR